MADLDEIERSSYVRITGDDEAFGAYVDSDKRLYVNAFNRPVNSAYKTTYLLNGASNAMNVNGSLITPVTFTYTPTNPIEYVESLNTLFLDNGVNNIDTFGVLAQLANGVLIDVQSNGVLYTLATIRNNGDMILFFSDFFSYSPTTSGFLNNSDVLIAKSEFKNNIVLFTSTSDFVRVRIRDNLTGLDFFRMNVKTWTEV
jgi:hypothetical protein